jgi:hypothetical protein
MFKEDVITITKFKREYPKSFAKFIEIDGDKSVSINLGIDSLLFHFGITIITQTVYDSNTSKILGHESFIKILPTNILKLESQTQRFIQDYKKFKNYDKAEKATILYALNLLEEALSLRSID